MVKVNAANRAAGIYRQVNTSIHTSSPIDRAQYNANQQAIQRTIFYNPV
jgi:NAD-dependent DNA ligase